MRIQLFQCLHFSIGQVDWIFTNCCHKYLGDKDTWRSQGYWTMVEAADSHVGMSMRCKEGPNRSALYKENIHWKIRSKKLALVTWGWQITMSSNVSKSYINIWSKIYPRKNDLNSLLHKAPIYCKDVCNGRRSESTKCVITNLEEINRVKLKNIREGVVAGFQQIKISTGVTKPDNSCSRLWWVVNLFSAQVWYCWLNKNHQWEARGVWRGHWRKAIWNQLWRIERCMILQNR